MLEILLAVTIAFIIALLFFSPRRIHLSYPTVHCVNKTQAHLKAEQCVQFYKDAFIVYLDAKSNYFLENNAFAVLAVRGNYNLFDCVMTKDESFKILSARADANDFYTHTGQHLCSKEIKGVVSFVFTWK
ncbi:MAG: hypothetical protein LAT55_13770 [Opitutales bacterium]|nr:hypothetical protein [Opitutales bacterium]